jgi:hypothetical protein
MAWEGVGVVMLGQRCGESWSVVDFVDLCHLCEKGVSACFFFWAKCGIEVFEFTKSFM